ELQRLLVRTLLRPFFDEFGIRFCTRAPALSLLFTQAPGALDIDAQCLFVEGDAKDATGRQARDSVRADVVDHLVGVTLKDVTIATAALRARTDDLALRHDARRPRLMLHDDLAAGRFV